MKSKRTGRTIKPALQRLVDNIKVTRRGCWEWQGCKNKQGYGHLLDSENNRTTTAHRYFYAQYLGTPIPAGFQVLHRCDNPACVYPKHLFLGTQQDNVDDMISKGRMTDKRVGVDNYRAKLTEEQVLEIRASYIPMKTSLVELGKKYGVTAQSIKGIVSRRSWKHI